MTYTVLLTDGTVGTTKRTISPICGSYLKVEFTDSDGLTRIKKGVVSEVLLEGDY